MTAQFSMTVLACDTTQQACSVALSVKGERDAFRLYENIGTGHAEHLPRMLAQALEETGLSVGDLDGLCVTTGPGTFAGVRVGLAAMRAFALAGKLPLYGMTGFEVMARTHLSASVQINSDIPLACVIDARRGQAYVQCFDMAATALGEPEVLAIQEAAEMLGAKAHVLIGTGAPLILDQFSQNNIKAALYPQSDILYPDAFFMLEICASGQLVASDRLAPLYLRPPDAALPKQDQRVKRK